LETLAANELAKAQRSLQARGVTWRRAGAQEALTGAADYRRHFGMRGKVAALPVAAWDAALARAERIVNPDPASAQRRERQAAQRKARARHALHTEFDAYAAAVAAHNAAVAEAEKRAPDAAAHWRATGEWLDLDVDYPPAPRRKRLREYKRAGFDIPKPRRAFRLETVLLRVNGDEIETSQGARIPLAAAPLVWAAVQRIVGRGIAYTPEGLGGMKIGDYAVREIRTDGTLIVGCHKIPHAELQLMAQRLGLT